MQIAWTERYFKGENGPRLMAVWNRFNSTVHCGH